VDLSPFMAAVLPPMTRQVAEALAPFAGVTGCLVGLKVDGVGVGGGVVDVVSGGVGRGAAADNTAGAVHPHHTTGLHPALRAKMHVTRQSTYHVTGPECNA